MVYAITQRLSTNGVRLFVLSRLLPLYRVWVSDYENCSQLVRRSVPRHAITAPATIAKLLPILQ